MPIWPTGDAWPPDAKWKDEVIVGAGDVLGRSKQIIAFIHTPSGLHKRGHLVLQFGSVDAALRFGWEDVLRFAIGTYTELAPESSGMGPGEIGRASCRERV